LRELKVSDAQAEAKSGHYNKHGCWAAVAMFLSIFMVNVSPYLAMVCGAVAVVYLIWALLMSSRHSAHNLANHRYELPLQLLESISVDLDPHKPVSMDIDFRSGYESTFRTNVEQPKFLGLFSYGTKVTFYRQCWLSLSATAADGQKLEVEIVQNGKLKEKPKRKRTKRTYRSSEVLTVNVRPARGETVKKVGPIEAPMGQSWANFRGQATERTASAKALSGRSASFSARHVAIMLAACFRALV